MAGPPARLVGVVAGVAALVVIGFDFGLFTSGVRVIVGLFTSGAGVFIAAVALFWIAAGLAALIEPAHVTRNASIVAITVAAIVGLYLAVASTRPAPPGSSYGGPNVLPPAAAVPPIRSPR
jgi:hypothetical protein